MEIRMIFDSEATYRTGYFSAYHLSSLLKIVEIFSYLASDEQYPKRKFSDEKATLFRFIGILDSVVLLRPIGNERYQSASSDLFLDALYLDLLRRRSKDEGLVFTGIEKNSPLKIDVAGSAKILTVAVALCGGEISIEKDGEKTEVELPGLIEVVERVYELVNESRNTSRENQERLIDKYLENIER